MKGITSVAFFCLLIIGIIVAQFPHKIVGFASQEWTDPPILISPGSSDFKNPTVEVCTPTFQWEEVEGADYYSLYIRDITTGELVFNSEDDFGPIYGNSFTLPKEYELKYSIYRWNMASHSSVGWSYERTDGGKKYSDQLYFTTWKGGIVKGIDVSHWQGNINWSEVYNEGYRFAFVKATEGYLNLETDKDTAIEKKALDPNLDKNVKGARNAGLNFIGVYHLARADLGNTPENEARWFLKWAGSYIKEGYLRPVLDIEKAGNLDKKELSQWVHKWMKIVQEQTNVEPILYTYFDFAKNNLSSSVAKYDLWIADYRMADLGKDELPVGIWTDTIKGWDFWQYSEKGSIKDIEGKVHSVDLNLFNGNISRLRDEFAIKILPKNVDVVLVIDRSGSMSGTKIVDAKWAAKQFVDLMQIGDKVGVVSFASTVRVDFSLSEITSIDTKVAVKDRIDLIYASGMTAMGDGLRTAYNQLVSYGDPSHPWAIVLMSNGWHNWGTEHPYNVIPDLKLRNIRVYTVGLGEGADSSLLGHIASETGGFYRFAPTSEDLLAIYNDIAARVGQAQTISSVSASIAQGETSQLSVNIDSSISQATFTISWKGSDLDLTLIRPDGALIDPSIATVDPDIEYIEEARYEIYRIDNPIAGTWQMVITAVDVPAEGETFFAQVTALTSVILMLETDKDSYTYPEPVKIIATLEDAGIPLIGANVQAIITRPDGSRIIVILFDDGLEIHGDANSNDGVYTNYFNQFNEDGSYTIKTIATGTTLIGENFTRETQKTILVSGVPFDTTPPKTTLFIGSPQYVNATGNIYVSSYTSFTLVAVDNNGAGSDVALTAYRIYNSTYNTGWIYYTIPFNLTGFSDGAYNIDYNSTDNAGNVEPTNTVMVILDSTPPETTLTIGEPKYISDTIYVTPETPFTLEAIDDGSGVYLIGYKVYNSTYDSGWLNYTGLFNLSWLTDGEYTIAYNSTDNVKNTETTHLINITLFSWNYVFEDSFERNTTLKINLEHKFFQFITADRDYGIRNSTYMRLCGRTIIIRHYDSDLVLITMALDTKLDFCVAIAWNREPQIRYMLIDRVGIES